MSDDDRAIMAAVASLRPGAGWNFNYGHGLAGLSWIDSRIARPSDAEIEAEIVRLAALPLAAAKLEQHLTSTIAELAAPKEHVMRGMKRLAFLTQDLVKNMDAEADKVADEIQLAHDRAQAAIDKFRQHGADIRKVADDIEAALGQITNSPTEASTGSSGTTSG
ncbi:hypothetical protein IVB40_07695 [Bradyrhizobium sp. 40]|uniref:hypothetical protein n=1 Tax=Bradyrhizobium sp. 40 TaxID=2782674 RepID=UPI001FFF5DC9|nr:hypothetical protein [Bradyrhizobium sp. 40]UPJ43943.1 hypothetical protein IVB40_07695 [Bradyrhizobium sp. 40]